MDGRTSITPGQQTGYMRLLEDASKRGGELALTKVLVDKDGMQRLLARGDEMATAIAEVIIAQTRKLSLRPQFADEEVESSYGYPSVYKPKPLPEQVAILHAAFPKLGTADETWASNPLPIGAEAAFAIPRWQKIASTYGEATEKVVAAIKASRRLHNYCEGQLGPQYLREPARMARMFERLGEQQKDHDILVVAAQFGLLHRGRSVRRAREVLAASEFELGPFAAACMLLTHPERLESSNDLFFDCGGEYSPHADGFFGSALYLRFYDDGVKFGFDWVHNAYVDCGLASAFLWE